MRTEKFMDLESETIFLHKGYKLKKAGRWHGEVLNDGKPISKGEKITIHATEKVEIISGDN